MDDKTYINPQRTRLNQGLLTLSSWCQSRASFDHDIDTTLTMLIRKANELREAVKKAGIHTPQTPEGV